MGLDRFSLIDFYKQFRSYGADCSKTLRLPSTSCLPPTALYSSFSNACSFEVELFTPAHHLISSAFQDFRSARLLL